MEGPHAMQFKNVVSVKRDALGDSLYPLLCCPDVRDPRLPLGILDALVGNENVDQFQFPNADTGRSKPVLCPPVSAQPLLLRRSPGRQSVNTWDNGGHYECRYWRFQRQGRCQARDETGICTHMPVASQDQKIEGARGGQLNQP